MAQLLTNAPTESTRPSKWHEHAVFAEKRGAGLRLLLRELPTGRITVSAASDSRQKVRLPPVGEGSGLADTAISETIEIIGITQRQEDVEFLLEVKCDQMLFKFRVWFDPHSSNVIVESLSRASIELRCLHAPTAAAHASLPLPGKSCTAMAPGLWELYYESTAILQCAVLEREQPRVVNTEQEAEESVDKSAGKRRRVEPANTLQQKATSPVVVSQAKLPFSLQPNEALILPRTDTDEPYELTMRQEIARTTSARVYEAWHNQYGKCVVVKSFAPLSTPMSEPQKSATSLQQIKNAVREYRITAELHDKAIAELHGWDARYLCLYIERIPGTDLARGAWIDEKWMFRGSREHVELILLDISRALAYIHGKDVIHYDLKPSNILYTPARGAVLCDFGMSDTSRTTSLKGGSPGYIPPEYAFQPSRGSAGDIWALGVVMLYLLQKISLPDHGGHECYFTIADLHSLSQEKHIRAKAILQAWTKKIQDISATLPMDDQLCELVRGMLRRRDGRFHAAKIRADAQAAFSASRPSPPLRHLERPEPEPLEPDVPHGGSTEQFSTGTREALGISPPREEYDG